VSARAAPRVVVTGAFDDLRPDDVRFLQEAARAGELHVAVLADEAARAAAGCQPKFPLEERRYILEALRFVSAVRVQSAPLRAGEVPPCADGTAPEAWAEREGHETAGSTAACAARDIRHVAIARDVLSTVPAEEPPEPLARPMVVVTGCFDWLHSGHIRFFEEAAALGTLLVVVGSDRNVRELKGGGHPRFPQEVRRFMVQAVRSVARAIVSTGRGWMDAAPEIERLRPDIYAVNADGDVPEKRAYCEQRGIRYVVLTRAPREGLPRRTSTDLRGF
jgi:cytidyltransferase-like protein